MDPVNPWGFTTTPNRYEKRSSHPKLEKVSLVGVQHISSIVTWDQHLDTLETHRDPKTSRVRDFATGQNGVYTTGIRDWFGVMF